MNDTPQRIVGSHTFLNDYENCPLKAYARHVAKTTPYVETAEMRWGNHVHKSCEKRLTIGEPLPKDLGGLESIILAVQNAGLVEGEKQLGCTAQWVPCSYYDKDKVKWRGKVDVPIFQHGVNFAVILDWKTGKEREDPAELKLHALMLHKHMPHLTKIIGHYVWVRATPQDATVFGGKLGEQHDLSDFERTQTRVDALMAHVERYAALNHWPARENPLCKWCDNTACSFNKKGK